MDKQQIVDHLSQAKDEVGVITSAGFHAELGNLTAADWRQAATMYPKSHAGKDGFYIEDENGTVVIHNDMRDARAHAVNSVGRSTLNDFKQLAEGALTVQTALTATGAAAGFGSALIMGEAAMGAATVTGAGIAALAGTAVIGAVAAADYPRNMIVKSIARDDVRTSETLRVNQVR